MSLNNVKTPDDADTLSQEISSYHGYILGFVCKKFSGRPQEWCEDVTQETMYCALRYAKSFQGRSSLKSWLCTIAMNCGRAALESGTRRKVVMSASDMEANAGESGLDTEDPHSPPVEIDIIQSELRKAVTTEIEHLSIDDALLLRLYFFEDMTVVEIATLFDENPNKTKTAIRRARLKLAGLLQKSGVDEHDMSLAFTAA